MVRCDPAYLDGGILHRRLLSIVASNSRLRYDGAVIFGLKTGLGGVRAPAGPLDKDLASHILESTT